MATFTQGSGTPLVLIPGIQGRWRYMQPAVDALSRWFRVITFDLCGEDASGECDPALGLDNYVRQTERALDAERVDRAVVCGISFGGVVAVRFAAERPDRTSALILVSTPGPGWHLSRRHAFYARFPWLFGPLFLAETPWRLRSELAAALPAWSDRWRFAFSQARVLLRSRLSLRGMAERARLLAEADVGSECSRIRAPTLVVTGEPHLDRVVSAEASAEYLERVRGARAFVLERSGHLGSIALPDAFAGAVRTFVEHAVGGGASS
jgi:3-oxoadipate enol-lactonase